MSTQKESLLGKQIILESGVGLKADVGANIEIPEVGILYMSLCGPTEVSMLLNRMGNEKKEGRELLPQINQTVDISREQLIEVPLNERGEMLAIAIMETGAIQVDLVSGVAAKVA